MSKDNNIIPMPTRVNNGLISDIETALRLARLEILRERNNLIKEIAASGNEYKYPYICEGVRIMCERAASLLDDMIGEVE